LEINIPMSRGLCLSIGSAPSPTSGYPTARLMKGLVLLQDGQVLAEEGVGFGVPVIKRGIQTIFPGHLEIVRGVSGVTWQIAASYSMNLEEKLATPLRGSLRSKLLYQGKNTLAALHRQFPLLRRPLTTISNGLRQVLSLETVFEETLFYGIVEVAYSIVTGAEKIQIDVDTSGLAGDGITEVVVMNEQGAGHFDKYQDSSGIFLQGAEIGSWDEVTADNATFLSTAHNLAFTLTQASGARLYRGRELIGSRLAWSGFGYTFPPGRQHISFAMTIHRLP
jgi:hypothetical protein